MEHTLDWSESLGAPETISKTTVFILKFIKVNDISSCDTHISIH